MCSYRCVSCVAIDVGRVCVGMVCVMCRYGCFMCSYRCGSCAAIDVGHV